MAFSWSWIFILSTLLLQSGYAYGQQNGRLTNDKGVAPAPSSVSETEEPSERRNVAVIVVPVIIAFLLLISLFGLFLFLYLRSKREQAVDVEDGLVDKPQWWMVDSKAEKKIDWWRLSHNFDAPPPAASDTPTGGRSHLERLKSALSRKGAQRRHQGVIPSVVVHKAVTSPTETIDLPLQSVPNPKPRYPSVLERGHHVPLYPVQSPPRVSPPPSRTLQSSERDRASRRNLNSPPRALVIPSGRPLLGYPDRKVGTPRSPANRKRDWLARHNLRHPFLPLKDTDAVPFPKISAPLPASPGDLTHPKLSYSYSIGKPRAVPPRPDGPRHERYKKIPPPIVPPRLLLPDLELGEQFGKYTPGKQNVFPPGLSPSYPRPSPRPI